MAFECSDKVISSRVCEYNSEEICAVFLRHFAELGIDKSTFDGKKTVIKPNLVMKKSPEYAATIAPQVLDGLLSALDSFGCKPTIAESPGGVYSAARLEGIYRVCGITDVAEKHGAVLNTDTTWKRMSYEGGRLVKSFNIITPVAEADIIIDLCKLKTHSLTVMSGAVKNLFGTIPGIEKFEAHAAYPEYGDFAAMLCDLCLMLCESKNVIAVTDAVIGMEGSGPTAGTPREFGFISTSQNPFASDLLSARVLGFDEKVTTVAESIKRGLCPEKAEGLILCGDPVPGVENVKPAEGSGGSMKALKFFSRGKIGRFFMPRPVIDTSACRGCGDCVRSCPQKTITLEKTQSGAKEKINASNCIRCYCCQELCPFLAVKIKRNFITETISKIK